MKKNQKYFYGFGFCIPDETIIEFIELNNKFNWEWNDIVDMLGEYKRETDLEYPECFPLVDYGCEDENNIEYWFEKFLEVYKDDIGDKTVYLIKTPN